MRATPPRARKSRRRARATRKSRRPPRKTRRTPPNRQETTPRPARTPPRPRHRPRARPSRVYRPLLPGTRHTQRQRATPILWTCAALSPCISRQRKTCSPIRMTLRRCARTFSRPCTTARSTAWSFTSIARARRRQGGKPATMPRSCVSRAPTARRAATTTLNGLCSARSMSIIPSTRRHSSRKSRQSRACSEPITPRPRRA